MILGLIFGLSTADSYYEELNNQIQTEQEKDKKLEAQLEQEIERQRELEAKLEKREGAEEPEQKEKETETAEDQDAGKSFKGIGGREPKENSYCQGRQAPGLWSGCQSSGDL